MVLIFISQKNGTEGYFKEVLQLCQINPAPDEIWHLASKIIIWSPSEHKENQIRWNSTEQYRQQNIFRSVLYKTDIFVSIENVEGKGPLKPALSIYLELRDKIQNIIAWKPTNWNKQ